jgi:hypothetical protein
VLNRPDARDLITLARETIATELAPTLQGEQRYQALMVANALAIALRELEHAEDVRAPAGERRRLQELYGDSVDAGEDLTRLNQRLAQDIRRGDLDGAVDLGLRRLFRAQVSERLRISNPRRAGD